jgi:hypothetical protein
LGPTRLAVQREESSTNNPSVETPDNSAGKRTRPALEILPPFSASPPALFLNSARNKSQWIRFVGVRSDWEEKSFVN